MEISWAGLYVHGNALGPTQCHESHLAERPRRARIFGGRDAMVRIVVILLIACFTHAASAQSEESSMPQGLHFFVGAGNNLIMPGTIRIGWDGWEFGRLSRAMFGVVKSFYI